MSESLKTCNVGIRRKQKHEYKNVNVLHVNSLYKNIKNQANSLKFAGDVTDL